MDTDCADSLDVRDVHVRGDGHVRAKTVDGRVVAVCAVGIPGGKRIVRGSGVDARRGEDRLLREDEVARAGDVAERDEPCAELLVGHHVAFHGLLAVRRAWIGVGELHLPAVGHAVAVGVPLRGYRLGVFLLVVGEAVAVAVAAGHEHIGSSAVELKLSGTVTPLGV